MKKTEIIWLGLIILSGVAIRFWLAFGTFNFDITAAWQDVGFFNEGKNIYEVQTAYNYTPFIYWIIGMLGKIHAMLPFMPFRFVVRAFTSFIDVLTLIPLLFLATRYGISRLRTAAFFFLNPVSVTISDHHGQYDNIAVLGLLTAVAIMEARRPNRKKDILAWFAMTIGFVVKHITMFQMLVFWRYYKPGRTAFLWFGASVLAFFISFVPYLSAHEDIIRQVFRYGGLQGFYGVSYMTNMFCPACKILGAPLSSMLMYIFIGVYFLLTLSINGKNVSRNILLSFLFFMAFTTGISAQYMILPIAFGALFPTKWFFLYSIGVYLFYLGSIDEYAIPAFGTFTWNTPWLFAMLWFFSELMLVNPSVRKLYRVLMPQRQDRKKS